MGLSLDRLHFVTCRRNRLHLYLLGRPSPANEMCHPPKLAVA
ncbi:hypothetical protein RMSM_03828 [Rhodopirellula maiorica SM1]|uniref:Uncharacterized protein n=1 Tax=Rhodopirellula maiorica SM1 TaxID=1265738 RepID=M5RZA7_9BACT|nr:hypothetical protein RMSM_03828 [Rhodopirellula maiorica SM1]